MGKGFDRLAIGGLAVGAASAALGGVADAALQGLPVSVFEDGYVWTQTNTTTADVGPAGMGLSFVSQTAFPFAEECPSGCLVYIINGDSYQDPDGVVDVITDSSGNTKVKSQAEFVDGDVGTDNIKAKAKYTYLADDDTAGSATVRVQYILKNVGLATDSVVVNIASEARGPSISGSENFDNAVTAADSWFIQAGATSPQSAVTWGRGDGWVNGAGNGGQLGAFDTDYPGGDNDYTETSQEISLAPDEKVQILFFLRVSPNSGSAGAGAEDFNGPGLPEFLLSNFGANGRAQVINWDL